MTLKEQFGLFRSRLIYYAKPFNRRRLKRFYGGLIKQGDLCFDIGSHLGNRADAWAQLGANVVAVEPQPACLKYLEKHFNSNERIQILAKAVGAQPVQMHLHVNALNPTVSTFANSEWREELMKESQWKTEWDQSVEVEIITLDQMIGQFGLPDFCKIDVEDFEEEVLKGLSQAIPKLSFEFFNYTEARTKNCLDLLEKLGDYQFNWSAGETQKWVMENWGNRKNLVNSIQSFPKTRYSGDIYARLNG